MSEYTPTTKAIRNYWVGNWAPSPRLEAQFDRWLAAELRKAKAEALREAAEALDNADDHQPFRSPTDDAPLGWTNESIEDALMSSGVIVDWLRARAYEMRGEKE